MLHLAQKLDTSDPLLMSDDERKAFLRPIVSVQDGGDWFAPGVAAARLRYAAWARKALRDDAPTAADIEDAANAPLLVEVETLIPPDDSYVTLDLDPDCYGYGAPATEAETMDAPAIDWDAMTEGATA